MTKNSNSIKITEKIEKIYSGTSNLPVLNYIISHSRASISDLYPYPYRHPTY